MVVHMAPQRLILEPFTVGYLGFVGIIQGIHPVAVIFLGPCKYRFYVAFFVGQRQGMRQTGYPNELVGFISEAVGALHPFAGILSA